MFDLANTGPVPDDLGTRKVFEKVTVPLIRLMEALEAEGQPLQGRRFVDCVIVGPCVVMPSGETRFTNCNMGEVGGDIRNLFLRAVGPMVIGAISLNDSVFEGCIFASVGFAGGDAFISTFTEALTPKKA